MKVVCECYFSQHFSVGVSWFYNEPLTITHENAHARQVFVTFYVPFFAWDVSITLGEGRKMEV